MSEERWAQQMEWNEERRRGLDRDFDPCQIEGCENEPVVDDFGVCVCELHLTPEIEAYLAAREKKEDSHL